MIKKTIAAFFFMALLTAHPARAIDEEAVMRCLLQEILASMTCKPSSQFRFVGKRDEVYVFNTYYAAVYSEFYCQVFDKDVVVTSKSWKGQMASARLKFDSQPGCIQATVNSPAPECHMPSVVQCCGSD